MRRWNLLTLLVIVTLLLGACGQAAAPTVAPPVATKAPEATMAPEATKAPDTTGMSVGGSWRYRQKCRLFGGMSCYPLIPPEATKNPLSSEEGGF